MVEKVTKFSAKIKHFPNDFLKQKKKALNK
jgi:hypothetical protein